MHDLIDKIRYAQLERRVGDALRDDGFPAVLHEKLRDGHDGPAGSILLCTDMTRGVGLFNLEYIVMDKHRLGNPVVWVSKCREISSGSWLKLWASAIGHLKSPKHYGNAVTDDGLVRFWQTSR